MSVENNRKRFARWKIAYIVIVAALILAADYSEINRTVDSIIPTLHTDCAECVLSDYELYADKNLSNLLQNPELIETNSKYKLKQEIGTIKAIYIDTIKNTYDRDYSSITLKINCNGSIRYYEIYEQTEIFFADGDDSGVLKPGDEVSFCYFYAMPENKLVSVEVEHDPDVTAELQAQREAKIRMEKLEIIFEMLPCMVVPNLFAAAAVVGFYFFLCLSVAVFGRNQQNNDSGSPIVTKGKFVFACAIIVITVIVNILLVYNFELPIIVGYVKSSCDDKYDTFPEYNGVVEEIIARGGEPFHRDPNTVYITIDLPDDVKASLEGSYESVDSVVIGENGYFVSPKVARIRVAGPDGDRWFLANSETYIYSAMSNAEGLTVIEKGQQVSFAYGSKDGIEDYDYVYAVKGKVPIQKYIRSLIIFAATVTIPCMLAAGFIILLVLVLSYSMAERIKRHYGVIVIAVIIILLTTIVWYGVDRYIKVATNVPASSITAHAPIIYLYPETDEQVNVRLTLNGKLTETYPEYKPSEGWTVTASPDGTMTDSDGNTYPFLFWEGELNMNYDLSRGFCVKGSDTEKFLDDALAQLGLSESEASDFKSYWLPLMESNPYNVITFQTTAYDDAVSHSVTPEPDTVISVNMLWYASDEFVSIQPQDLTGINPSLDEREGFVFVEWGGEEIDSI